MLKFVKGLTGSANSQQRGLLKSLLVFFTLCVVTLGQWNGARMMVESIYTNFITHFTNHIEYQELEQVRVGANLAYLETIFGAARLIKSSNTDTSLDYRYYHNNKYLLALAVSNSRVEGFQIIALQANFQPSYIFNHQRLNAAPFAEQFQSGADFTVDNANLRFYKEAHDLGREGLFSSIYPSIVSYGASVDDAATADFLAAIDALNHAYVLDIDKDIEQSLARLRQRVTANAYSFGNISLETATDMTLTEFEYLAYFNQL